jgi:hypothetical protein
VQGNIARGAPCPKGYLTSRRLHNQAETHPAWSSPRWISFPCGFLFISIDASYLDVAGEYSMEFYHIFKKMKILIRIVKVLQFLDKEKLRCRGC